MCLTFHALCGRCPVVARDDAQLEEAVLRAERGELAPRDVPPVRRVLIDEAQDVRPLYARLVRAVGLAREDVAIVAAGDRHQLVYDFDPDFPASLDLLLRPEALLGGAAAWERTVLATSHRLTPPVAALVNAVFGTAIQSAAGGAGGAAAPPAPGGGARAAQRVRAAARCATCSPPRRRRAPCSSSTAARATAAARPAQRAQPRGRRAARARRRRRRGAAGRAALPHLLGAKGLECDTAVVLLRARRRAPTYVALARAAAAGARARPARAARGGVPRRRRGAARVRRARAPRPRGPRRGRRRRRRGLAAARAARGGGGRRRRARRRPRPRRAAARAPGRGARAAVRRGRGVRSGAGCARARGLVVHGVDVSRAAVAMALVAAEARACGGGRVRAMEEVLHPARMEPAPCARRRAGHRAAGAAP